MLKLFNTLSQKKEVFKALKNKRVGLYTCGPTVYDYVHIGNLRTYVFEDILKRVLLNSDYKVNHIMNITDVDDKTIKGSREAGLDLKTFTQKYENYFKEDLKKLNILMPTKFTRAIENIPAMVSLINILLKKKIAYTTADGVYFDISKFKSYGRLSNLKKRELKAGARVSADEYAKDAAQDFALWKAAKLGEPFWKTPFGNGRPGWHIECSAMSSKYLGQPFDIHAAGVDLIFPHHENEIAQSEAASDKPFVKYWIHGEHLLVEGKKMSKSLGNTYRISDLEAKGFNPLAFRYLTLTSHYRSRLNFTWKSLKGAQSALESIEAFVFATNSTASDFLRKKENDNRLIKFKEDFYNSISDDLNTPEALAVLHKLMNEFYRKMDGSDPLSPKEVLNLIFDFDKILGLGLNLIKHTKTPLKIKNLLKEREKYRTLKEWDKADDIRDKINKAGYEIDDSELGPILKKG